MAIVVRLLREPLFHFLVIGALLFGLYTIVSGPAPEPVNRIVIGSDQVARLVAGFKGVWQRPPSDEELRAMVEGLVREEVYYREALALGLERDDTIIRRRLQQKMEFLTDSGADLLQPGEGELEAWYAANQEQFRSVPRIALTQVFLGADATPERIDSVLASIRSEPDTDPMAWGERTLLQPRMSLSTPAMVDSVFGAGFFEQLEELPVGGWSGPVASGYGIHLVHIDQSLPGSLPAFDEMQAIILEQWKEQKARELTEQVYARLRQRYEVELPEGLDRPTP